jgi:hypothetical protein
MRRPVAQATARFVRLFMPSFASALETCFFTVSSSIWSTSAI